MAANDLTGENMDATAPGEAVSPCQVMDCSPSTARAASVRQEASPGREDAPSWTGPAQEGPGSYTSSPDTGQLHAAIEKLHAAGGQEPVVARRGECRCPLTKELPSCVGSCGIGPQLGHHRLSAHIVDSFGLVAVPEDALLTQVPADGLLVFIPVPVPVPPQSFGSGSWSLLFSIWIRIRGWGELKRRVKLINNS